MKEISSESVEAIKDILRKALLEVRLQKFKKRIAARKNPETRAFNQIWNGTLAEAYICRILEGEGIRKYARRETRIIFSHLWREENWESNPVIWRK